MAEMQFCFKNAVPFSVNTVSIVLFLTLPLTFQKEKENKIGKWKLNNSTSCSLGKVSVRSYTLATEIGREKLSGMCKNQLQNNNLRNAIKILRFFFKIVLHGMLLM